MELGLALPNLGRHRSAASMLTLARAAEELGFDSVWTSEHVVVPAEMFDPYGDTLDSLTTLAYVAAATERVRLGTSVLILPLHEPVLLAKQASTLHALSGGRLQLGVGVGWIAEEFELMGADFEGRGQVMDRSVAVLRSLLAGDADATLVPPALVGLPFAPPVESPLPILVGGHAPSALRRAARLGDGWHGVWLEPDELPSYVAATRAQSARPGFRISVRTDFRIVDPSEAAGGVPGLVGRPDAIAAKMLQYRAAGVDELVIDFMNRDHGGVPDLGFILDQLHRFRAEVPADLS
ncbi:LLM class flavin-dependent oxidoreductase [uncultured Friedmanniella sp.]|uniref:LLM class flavin-dependent oxidoreductase n=1 Tax=uncultured Friedmanniella sp. TaxID=335381 RepID=UPI0035CC823A